MTLQTRATLDKELAKLDTSIIRLASMVDTAIDHAMAALYQRDVELAQSVVAQDESINLLRYEIEQECLLILARQQPFASDLRTVLTANHMASELERMGDHAAGIARLVERMESEESIDTLHKLPKMAKRARQMIEDGIKAFVERDLELAQSLVRRDDKIDKQYRKLFQETLEEMRDDDYIRRATFLLWVGHNLERIGDRATNVAERVVFMITGSFIENDVLIDWESGQE